MSFLDLRLSLQPITIDTLDLQSQDAPSAKDHTRQPTHPSPVGLGPAAPHQNQTLRNAEQEALQEQMNSPRVSHDDEQPEFTEEPDFFDDQDDEAHDAHPAGDGSTPVHPTDDSGIEDSDIGDQADEDGLDDDLMDKISSSPSIDDGKYPISVTWPSRVDSMEAGTALSLTINRYDEPRSSSPYVSTPEHYPIHFCNKEKDEPQSHDRSKSPSQDQESSSASTSAVDGSPQSSYLARFRDLEDAEDETELGLDPDAIDRFLVPLNDPLLNGSDEAESDQFDSDEDAENSEWEDDEETESHQAESSSDDDSGNFVFTDDSRFIDSGWGGECLREVEDIDFEFVYALHTFVATVEGQANATKGDTMVLLDDSNSYWWLVRVVKDGSIGKLARNSIVAAAVLNHVKDTCQQSTLRRRRRDWLASTSTGTLM
jgi:hypothetical protein